MHMSALEFLNQLPGISLQNLSKKETLILEAELFTRLCEKLRELFIEDFKDYFRLLNFNIKKENVMTENKFLRCIIDDVLATGDYTLSGIAYYTQIPIDVIYDIAIGINTDPSSTLFKKLIALHRSVRPDLYSGIIKKIILDYHP